MQIKTTPFATILQKHARKRRKIDSFEFVCVQVENQEEEDKDEHEESSSSKVHKFK
jgi:hypothetical protein